jgi:hypothetical protein
MCHEEINVLKLPHAVWQSFMSIFPHLSGGTMATRQTCCHLLGELLNSAAECADRARIHPTSDGRDPDEESSPFGDSRNKYKCYISQNLLCACNDRNIVATTGRLTHAVSNLEERRSIGNSA